MTDGIWTEAAVKAHVHIIVRCVDRKKRIRVRTIMKDLGIVFRKGVDDALWREHGVETIGNYTGYAVYLTHETKEAIDDAKERYSIDELISNLTKDEIIRIRDGYTRVSANAHKVTHDELAALDQDAYNLGYEMKNFAQWFDNQPFSVRSHAKIKTIRESYERGVAARLEEGREVNRLCIFIQGQPNSGKTYAAKAALGGKQILPINGGGTGKFDNLRPDHDAIVIDDQICPNLLNMTDNYMCRVYRRNRDNPVWAGRYFIVTSNLPFAEWLDSCGLKVKGESGNMTEHYAAMLSRFFVCEIRYIDDIAHLALISPSTRGTAQEQLERAEMFSEFAESFNYTIATYTAVSNYNIIHNLIAKLDPYNVYWDNLEDELEAEKVASEPNWDEIEAYAEYQMRKELGEPVTFIPGSCPTVCFPTGYKAMDWCNPDRPPEQREELKQEQLKILEKWNRQQAAETAQRQQAAQPQPYLYNPADRQY